MAGRRCAASRSCSRAAAGFRPPGRDRRCARSRDRSRRAAGPPGGDLPRRDRTRFPDGVAVAAELAGALGLAALAGACHALAAAALPRSRRGWAATGRRCTSRLTGGAARGRRAALDDLVAATATVPKSDAGGGDCSPGHPRRPGHARCAPCVVRVDPRPVRAAASPALADPHETVERALPPPLYARVMGARFDALPRAGAGDPRRQGDGGAAGEGTRRRAARSRSRGCSAAVMRFPPAGDYPLHVGFAERDGVETWTRDFGGHRFRAS